MTTLKITIYHSPQEVTPEDMECECWYDCEGNVEEWCDVCMFGSIRAARYRNRDIRRAYGLDDDEEETEKEVETNVEKREELEMSVKDRLICQELMGFLETFHTLENVDEKLESIQQILRYLWDKQAFLVRYPSLLSVLRAKCEEWMNDVDAAPIQSTVLMTIELLSALPV